MLCYVMLKNSCLAVFKYSDKQQPGILVRSRALAAKAFLAYLQPRQRTWWQQLRLFSSAKTCLFETKNCYVHQCLAKFRTFQNQGHFPGLSDPGNSPQKSRNFHEAWEPRTAINDILRVTVADGAEFQSSDTVVDVDSLVWLSQVSTSMTSSSIVITSLTNEHKQTLQRLVRASLLVNCNLVITLKLGDKQKERCNDMSVITK